MRSWLKATARAIDAEPSLRVYAAILSTLHALTAAAWVHYKHIADLVTGDDCVCWPLLEGCERARSLLSPAGVRIAVSSYAALGLLAAALFLARRAIPALGVFLAAGAIGLGLCALDYRLRLNQTYMFGWVVGAFLLAPRRAQVVPVLVALFYFWAGTLKWNREWLSGAALYARPLFVPEALVPASCAYVVCLEVLLVWGLFARDARIRWIVWAQLVLFHLVSWSVVGFFYPLLMLGLIAIYPLSWHAKAAPFERDARRGSLAVAALFSAFQLVPYFFPGDPAVTGEGRLFALHMFDARVECEGGAILQTRAGARSRVELINPRLEPRLRCDPIVLFAEAERLCRLVAARPEPPRVDVLIEARRSTDPAAQPLIDVTDLCAQSLAYSPWHHNAWIGARVGAVTRAEASPATTNSARNGE